MFKKGDKVRCIKGTFGNSTTGKIYEVEKYYDISSCPLNLDIVADDNGTANAYASSTFELANPPESASHVSSSGCECGAHSIGFNSHSHWCPINS